MGKDIELDAATVVERKPLVEAFKGSQSEDFRIRCALPCFVAQLVYGRTDARRNERHQSRCAVPEGIQHCIVEELVDAALKIDWGEGCAADCGGIPLIAIGELPSPVAL